MIEIRKWVREQVRELDGVRGDDAFHALSEAEDTVIPLLVEAYQGEEDPKRRAILVQVIREHRLPHSADFLEEALEDPSPEVWKQALDGLVTLGGPEVKQTLQRAMARAQGRGKAGQEEAEWIGEALEQTR